jgi:HD-GYP domain-containing protein (c-di-GMP phosphodiesterase class II)
VRFAEQQALFMGSLRALTAAIDAKDPYTRGHSERVAHVAGALSVALGQGDETAERVRIAGLVHDIGKIGVPETILCKPKPGRLTDEEFEAIKKHPEIGYRILKDVDPFQDLLPGVLHHHERWDGRGYPHKLAGENIPMIARIIGLADTFDAMSSTRSYRPALPRDHVLREIERGAGTQFDPRIVEAFRAVNLAGYDELMRRPDETPNMGMAA